MEYIKRNIEDILQDTLKRGKSVLLLGPRQTGKTTLLKRLKSDLYINLAMPDARQRYEKDASLLLGEIKSLKVNPAEENLPLVLLDEIQKVPSILDAVQALIDEKKARFVLTGSSARKLRRGTNINLLPGRLIGLKLDPITIAEFPGRLLEDILLYGSLPGIIEQETVHREADLESYVTLYLEEEVRAEAIVRNLGLFARFLEYAAAESGKLINFRKLSNEIGVAHTTIASYFQILEDCLIIERIEPITASATRKKLIQTQKFLFFDLGVRRTAAREGPKLPRATMGFLFEQFIGIELIRNARFHGMKTKVRFWRDPNGPEVDWVIEKDDMFIPIEVKLTDAPSKSDTRHLTTFIEEYKNAPKGYIVCQTPRQITLTDKISAIPWQDLQMLF